jgi:diaminopimelate decarboxylase
MRNRPPAQAADAKIDDCLSVRAGRLHIEGCDAATLARKFGTPLYVVSEDQLRRNVRRFRTAFESRWREGTVHILPSIKANFTLALLRILAEEGTGCDTFGPGELHAALRAGIPGNLMSVNGSSKDDVLIEAALKAGARITLDSAEEVERVRDVAGSLSVRARVRFRIRPRYQDLDQPSDFYDDGTSVRIAAARYKPGIPIDDLLRVGPSALQSDELDVTGVMVHLGRHSSDLAVWRGMVGSCVELIAELSRAWEGWQPREIDLGGGFATPRDPTGTARGSPMRKPAMAPSIEEYADVLTTTLRGELKRRGLDPAGKVLEVEPGRSLFADAGVHLTTIRGVKAQGGPEPWSWVETDTTEMFLLDTILERNRWTTIVAEKASLAPTQKADIVGISCSFDVIVHQADLPNVASGDVVAFLDTGAYQDATANNFNALPRPGVVLVHGPQAELVKRAETVADVFRRDRIPTRLRGRQTMEVLE